MAALLLFIKNPVKGAVKTRLAQTVGDDRALQIYLALQAHVRAVALKVPVERWLFYDAWVEPDDLWDPSLFCKLLQDAGDLGWRMSQALRLALAEHDRAVLIGSDCPKLSPQILEDAFAALEEADVVLGPAEDGGYYLVGLKKWHPSLFEDIHWSAETVLEETLAKVDAQALTCVLLPTLPDVDYEEDWNRHGWPLAD